MSRVFEVRNGDKKKAVVKKLRNLKYTKEIMAKRQIKVKQL